MTGAAAVTNRAADRYLLGLMLVTVYLPPPASARVNSTDWPAFTLPRSTSGATGKSIVMAGQLMAGIGPWLRFTICLAGSTFFTVPVPTASLPAGVCIQHRA